MTTIGVFDSGVGGLTVLRALLPLIPGAHFVYLGDTARLPYGSKSQETIARYAVSAAQELEARGAQRIVIACNTATALALPQLRAACRGPVIGVIDPGADAALAASSALAASPRQPEPSAAESKDLPHHTPPPAHPTISAPAAPHILVLATAATVASHAYRDALAHRGLDATEKACPLLVPLVEEGWVDHAVTRDVLRIYLREALDACASPPAAVVLGCTHYPLIAPAIEATLRELGSDATVVDSAAATANAVAATLTPDSASIDPATFSCLATDGVQRFAHLGSRFLNRPIPAVELLDLGG